MIFIDPPYNTGNEFIYPDNFQDNLDTYLQYTGHERRWSESVQQHQRLWSVSHPWLNMMYPRLKLSKSLLQNDGAIFISIDDSEAPRLRMLCDEVFGEENFITNIIWQHSVQQKASPEYFLCTIIIF